MEYNSILINTGKNTKKKIKKQKTQERGIFVSLNVL